MGYISINLLKNKVDALEVVIKDCWHFNGFGDKIGHYLSF